MEEKFRVSPLFVQIMMMVSRPSAVIHLCSCIWVVSFCLHRAWRGPLGAMRGMKAVPTRFSIRRLFQVTFDTGIKVRFLCLRFQVIFVNGSN